MVYTGGPRASGGIEEARGICMTCRHAWYSKRAEPGEWWWRCMNSARPDHLFQPTDQCKWHAPADLSHWTQRVRRAV